MLAKEVNAFTKEQRKLYSSNQGAKLLHSVNKAIERAAKRHEFSVRISMWSQKEYYCYRDYIIPFLKSQGYIVFNPNLNSSPQYFEIRWDDNIF